MAAAPEVAPLVDGADGEAEPEEDPLKLAEREVAEADGLLRRWGEGRRDTAPFDLTVKPMIGGAEAAVTLAGVTSQMSVSELHDRVHAEMASHPTPDEQRLFIVDRGKGPLRCWPRLLARLTCCCGGGAPSLSLVLFCSVLFCFVSFRFVFCWL